LLKAASVHTEASKSVPQGLKPSLAEAICGTPEAVPFLQSRTDLNGEVENRSFYTVC